MMQTLIVLVALLAAAAALPAEMPEPGQLALILGEEEFEDYLDAYLEYEQNKSTNSSYAGVYARSGCTIRVNGDLGQPQPVYIRSNRYLLPSGSGQIRLKANEQVVIACPGSGRTIRHPNIASNVNVATARCVNNAQINGAGWLNGNGAFRQLTCSAHAHHEAQGTTTTRCFGNNIVIRVGYIVNNVFHTLYFSCYNLNRMEVLYVWYDQTPENAVHQTGVDRPIWLAGSFYPGVAVNTMYTQVQQKATIAQYVGNNLANKYVTNHQFLARGHLAAKSDFVFATGQRSTFYFINAAPQWQSLNAGNWNWLEQNLRARIGRAGYRTVIYTGTFGVTQLRDSNNRFVDIYLVRHRNQIPVPLYFYKVVYDASRRIGTAFISINNPHYTLAEARSRQFCTDRCRNNSAFNWIRWQPDRVDIGYSFCCTIDDFRRTVPHLPSFVTNGLLS